MYITSCSLLFRGERMLGIPIGPIGIPMRMFQFHGNGMGTEMLVGNGSEQFCVIFPFTCSRRCISHCHLWLKEIACVHRQPFTLSHYEAVVYLRVVDGLSHTLCIDEFFHVHQTPSVSILELWWFSSDFKLKCHRFDKMPVCITGCM